jgi:hypothetical protein
LLNFSGITATGVGAELTGSGAAGERDTLGDRAGGYLID